VRDIDSLKREVIKKLEELSDPKVAEGIAKYGIKTSKIYGVSIPNLRKIAKEIGKNHRLALALWEINTRETRIIACLIDDPKEVTEEQLETWVSEFDNWEICDQCCSNLFEKTKYAYDKAIEWASRKEEFVKRAGFVLMARLALKGKKIEDNAFEDFFQIIKRESKDEREYVKKAISWALRQIGKRNLELNKRAIEVAKELLKIDSMSAQWIAREALKELTSERIQNKLRKSLS